MPPKSTELRMSHFDENVYNAFVGTSDTNTVLFKFIDALCGDAGAGSLKKEVFLQRLSSSLDSIYGSDLDYIFGNVRFLSRASSEAYTYNPMSASLTSEEWDEVYAKDAQYRSRVREYFTACGLAGTADGIRHAVHAAISSDCQVMESWRYIDNFGISSPLGRSDGSSYAATELSTGHQMFYTTKAEADAFVVGKTGWRVQQVRPRSEVTIVPHKTDLTPRENRLLLDMLAKINTVDTVVTINPNGLSVHAPVRVRAIAADSTYYQVEKMVTGTPILEELPAPELLAIDLDPSENWLNPRSPELAPYAQFNITQEYGYTYLVSGGNRSPIDQVDYGILQEDGSTKTEPPLDWYEQTEQYGAWTGYDIADSPDNYPGGKFGLTPASAPALNPDRSPYHFVYTSQSEYVTARKAEVIRLGGEANDVRYRLPTQKTNTSKRVYTPDLAIAYTAPTRESTVTSGWTSRKLRGAETRNPSLFVRR
jgi:hypothetical protein